MTRIVLGLALLMLAGCTTQAITDTNGYTVRSGAASAPVCDRWVNGIYSPYSAPDGCPK